MSIQSAWLESVIDMLELWVWKRVSRPSGGLICKACHSAMERVAPVTATLHDRSYHRCPGCGLIGLDMPVEKHSSKIAELPPQVIVFRDRHSA